MAQLGTTVDHTALPPDERSFDLIPSGWYLMHAIESDVQANSQGTGKMALFTWEILDGQFKSRRIWQKINYQHQSAQAQEIGQREMGNICRALNLPPITDTAVVEFKPVLGRVGVEKGTNGHEDKNKVTAFKPYAAGQPGAASPTPAGHQGAGGQQARPASASGGQAASGGARPWAKA